MPLSQGGSGGATPISGVVVTGTAAAGQVPVASSAIAGAWAYPPAFEIGYTQITANVNVVSTTESAGTTIISPGALTFDGGAVIVEFFAVGVTVDTSAIGDSVVFSLFESSTQITRLAFVQTQITTNAHSEVGSGRYRFTPTSGSHTYTVTAFASSTTGTPKVVAGSGGTNGYPPAFVRFVKV